MELITAPDGLFQMTVLTMIPTMMMMEEAIKRSLLLITLEVAKQKHDCIKSKTKTEAVNKCRQ